ncbi:hypothetical protein [Alcanivorax sp. DP30]|uniref:hypothetical protein n=1 Tax=Alcanivorax sp. DP30 TaxID=2606217 RepID=UPI00136FEA9C|nr:hypothetical protein [Alcanivorax sp. DP30]MZR64033.1 hypothetical protein [Alcanivorax sp. DP30]
MNTGIIDYIGMWYQARAKLGVDDRIDFMFDDPATGKRTNVILRHRDYDGVGGILASARQVGMIEPLLPSGKHRKPPSFWRRWQRKPLSREAEAPQWEHFETQQAPSVEPLMGWLTRAETQGLLRYADSQQVSLNSLLLLALHRAVCDTLMQGRAVGSWCFPVNMRNAITIPRQEMNLSSAFYLTVSPDDAPADIDRAIRANLKANVHWRFWHLARVGRFIGQRGVDWLCARMLNGKPHCGSFSSLGEWQMDFISAGMAPDTTFCCCGPGSPNHPVANGVMIVNGRLTLALRLHPSLGADQARAEQCLQHWKNGLLEWI